MKVGGVGPRKHACVPTQYGILRTLCGLMFTELLDPAFDNDAPTCPACIEALAKETENGLDPANAPWRG